MAKRKRRIANTDDGQTVGPGNDKLNALAGDLGRLLGTAHAKARSWIDQRQVVATELAKIRDTATAMLSALGGSGKRRGRPRGVKAAPVKRKRTISAAGRAKISAAQKKRWAKLRKDKADE